MTPMSLQDQLAHHVPEKRKFRKLTQAQLGQLIGTSQTAIARIEKGRGNPTFDLLQRLSNALDLEFTLFVRPQR